MAEYIAHASIDENGKIAGGKAGDQTGKEICIRTWYNKKWSYVLRITDEKVRTCFANNMIDLANNNKGGYDQNQRNTLLTQAEKVEFDFSKITTACECDCSSAVTICILGAIYKVCGKAEYEKAKNVLVVSGNCATTSTIKNRLLKLDVISVLVYTSKTYTTDTTRALYGDIYNREGSHVVCYIGDGKKRGATEEKVNNAVLDWQKAAIADGFKLPKYGADGEWGSECVSVAKSAVCKKRTIYKYKNLTKIVQRAVGVNADGLFGKDTKDAVIAYQKKNGLTADGCVGLNAWKKILKV